MSSPSFRTARRDGSGSALDCDQLSVLGQGGSLSFQEERRTDMSRSRSSYSYCGIHNPSCVVKVRNPPQTNSKTSCETNRFPPCTVDSACSATSGSATRAGQRRPRTSSTTSSAQSTARSSSTPSRPWERPRQSATTAEARTSSCSASSPPKATPLSSYSAGIY